MDINKRIYSELSAKERAVAAFLAINRDDGEEVDRLFANVPRGRGHGQAVIGIGQAMETYNRFSAGAVCNYLIMSGILQNALSYCSAWLDAGGVFNAEKYREKVAVIEQLKPKVEKLAGDVYAIRQAAYEWCEKQQIPVDIFAQPLCFFPLPSRVEEVSESEELSALRSCFDKITLAW